MFILTILLSYKWLVDTCILHCVQTKATQPLSSNKWLVESNNCFQKLSHDFSKNFRFLSSICHSDTFSSSNWSTDLQNRNKISILWEINNNLNAFSLFHRWKTNYYNSIQIVNQVFYMSIAVFSSITAKRYPFKDCFLTYTFR